MFIQYARMTDLLGQISSRQRLYFNFYQKVTLGGYCNPTILLVEIDAMFRDGDDDIHWLAYRWQDSLEHIEARTLKDLLRRGGRPFEKYRAHEGLYFKILEELKKIYRVVPGRYTLPREFVMMKGDLEIAWIEEDIEGKYGIGAWNNWIRDANRIYGTRYLEE